MIKALLDVLIHMYCNVYDCSTLWHAFLLLQRLTHHGVKECEPSACEQPESCPLYSLQITENCCGFSMGSEQQFVRYMSLY